MVDLERYHRSVHFFDDLQICPNLWVEGSADEDQECNRCIVALNSTTAFGTAAAVISAATPGLEDEDPPEMTEKSGATLCPDSTGRSRSYSSTLAFLGIFPADPMHLNPSHEGSPAGDHCRSPDGGWIQTRRCPTPAGNHAGCLASARRTRTIQCGSKTS